MPMIPVVLFAAALVVRVGVFALFPGPAYPDSYYYTHVAQQLAAGHGLVTDYLWNLDDLAGGTAVLGTLPLAANGYWMPLTELVQTPFVWLLGPSAIAASLPFMLLGAGVAPLAYFIGLDAGLDVSLAGAGAALCVIPMGLTPYVVQPDNFALFMFLSALALWLCARGARGDRRAFVLGGLVVGLATLTRADGVLLGLPYVAAFMRGLDWRAALLSVALFVLVLIPWLSRQIGVFGSPIPGAGTLWLTDYQQLFSFSNQPTLDGWTAQGFSAIAASRLGGLVAALGLFGIVCLGVVFAPFAAAGAWLRRREAAFRPFFVYAVALFALMTLLFPVLVPHGTFLHAAAALVPHTLLLAAVGVDAVVRWVATRRPSWDADRAARGFTFAAIAIALVVGGFQTLAVVRDWSVTRETQQGLVSALADAPRTDRFMAVDPGAINYLSARQGVLTPTDDLATIESTLRAYDVRWLVLEQGSIVPALVPVLSGDVHPGWLSAPVAVVPSAVTAPVATTNPVAASNPAGAVYAVCLTPGDQRCQP